jgi:asparagine synthase (glutamine-hydrolysing)
MSTHYGTFQFDPRERIPDADWDVRVPGLALAQRGGEVWINPVASTAPARVGRLIAGWDGRLDNRTDLCLRLGCARTTYSDAELALTTFERWRTAGLSCLLGDWSVAICDDDTRMLHLARDYMGARPLYYYLAARAVHWSTDLGELVVRVGRSAALSDAFAAQFMSLRRSGGITPYEGIHAVPAGTCLSFGSDGLIANRFWRLETDEVRYRDSRTYEEQLRSLWREAVAARLRFDGTAWAELSGGLDSSSVACLADRLIRAGDVQAGGLRFVSHATLHSPEGDERRFIAEVERQVGVNTEIVGVEDNQTGTDPQLAWITPDALQAVGLETARRVRQGGGRVVLSGRLGDAVMGCQPDNSIAVLDDFARLDLFTALKNMRRWSRATRKPFIEIACRLLATERAGSPDTGIALLTPRLRAMLLDGRRRDHLTHVRRSKRPFAAMLLGYADGGRLDIPYRSTEVVYTYPFAHRALIEFMLAIPGDQLSAPGNTRALMRRAFAGFVPERILRRQSKGYYPPAAFRAARQAIAAQSNVRDFEAVQRGWIDPDRLEAAIHTLTAGSGVSGGDVYSVLRLERWLEARRQHSPIPSRKEVNDHAVLHA